MQEPLPPSDIEAEGCVLGEMFGDERALAVGRDWLKAADFYRPAHAIIFQAMIDMAEHNEKVDIVSLRVHLQKIGRYTEVGGDNYLAGIGEVPAAGNTEYYAKTVRNCAAKRELIRIGADLRKAAYDPGTKAEELFDEYQAKLYALDRRTQATRGQEAHAHEAAARVLADLQERVEHPGTVDRKRFSTGFACFDKVMHGFRNGHLVILAGETKAGKTAMALQMASAVAEAGGACLYISTEMVPDELATRLLQARAHVHGDKIVDARTTLEELERLSGAEGILRQHRFYLVGRACALGEIAQKARAMGTEWQAPINLIVVDYLTAMRLPAANELRIRVGEMTTGLKRMAMELDCCVLCLSQLSRAESGKPTPPGLHALKESGSIENDANSVLMLYRPEPNGIPIVQLHEGIEYLEVWARVAACRDGRATPWPSIKGGPEGSIRVLWKPGETRFVEP